MKTSSICSSSSSATATIWQFSHQPVNLPLELGNVVTSCFKTRSSQSGADQLCLFGPASRLRVAGNSRSAELPLHVIYRRDLQVRYTRRCTAIRPGDRAGIKEEHATFALVAWHMGVAMQNDIHSPAARSGGIWVGESGRRFVSNLRRAATRNCCRNFPAPALPAARGREFQTRRADIAQMPDFICTFRQRRGYRRRWSCVSARTKIRSVLGPSLSSWMIQAAKSEHTLCDLQGTFNFQLVPLPTLHALHLPSCLSTISGFPRKSCGEHRRWVSPSRRRSSCALFQSFSPARI